jgi:hypothetical protein
MMVGISGDVPLSHPWGELSPIMAISGLFTFAWTTAQIFYLVGIHDDVAEEMRLNYRKGKALRRAGRAQVQLVRGRKPLRRKRSRRNPACRLRNGAS